jgi:peroxiredoxin
MIRKWFLLTCILAGFIVNLNARPSVIYGTASEYAGDELVFYRYGDRITNTEVVAGKCKVDSSGKFSMEIPVENITYIFAELGIYQAFLYIVPGKSYEIALPAKKEKTMADRLNPFFQPEPLHFGVLNYHENDLNTLIRMFNDAYIPYYNKYVYSVVTKENHPQLDADIKKIEAPFKSDTTGFFYNYRIYKYGMLRNLAFQKKAKSLSDTFFKNKPVLYNNPAYMDLFNQIYNKYFQFFSRTEDGSKIFDDINVNKDYYALKATLKKDQVLQSDTLLELVILKGIHDEFYNDKFSRSALLQVLDTLISNTKIKEDKIIGENIREKVTKLLVGFAPPDFHLYNTDSVLISLDSLRGKYVYLNFCTCFSYSCMNEFELLKGLYQRHKDKLEIVTVTVDDKIATVKNFIQKRGYNWTFLLYSNQPDILKDYDIRGFPVYYLIGPDGKLVLSPAPGPSENFESKLFNILKSRGVL